VALEAVDPPLRQILGCFGGTGRGLRDRGTPERAGRSGPPRKRLGKTCDGSFLSSRGRRREIVVQPDQPRPVFLEDGALRVRQVSGKLQGGEELVPAVATTWYLVLLPVDLLLVPLGEGVQGHPELGGRVGGEAAIFLVLVLRLSADTNAAENPATSFLSLYV